MTTETKTPTPLLDRIAAGESLEASDDIMKAMREIIPAAEHWVGQKFVLECNEKGWSIAYTHGNNYRDRLTDWGDRRWRMAEDAIQALAELAARNKAEFETKEAARG